MEQHPQERANFLSKITFYWLHDLLKYGHKNEITGNDIQNIRRADASAKLSKTFSLLWATEFNSGRKSLLNVCVKLCAAKVIFCGLLFSILDTICRVLQPQFLGLFISYFSPNNDHQNAITIRQASFYAAGTILCSLIPVLVFHPFFLFILNIGQRLRIACCSLLYKKVLKYRALITDERFDEKVINLISGDMNKIDYALATGHEIFRAPLEAFFIGIFVYVEIGVAGLIGMLLMLACVPLLFYIGKKSSVYRLKASHHTEQRVNLMSEIIKHIASIKSFCMEQVYAKNVKDSRSKEINMLRSSLYLRAAGSSMILLLKFSIFVCIVTALNMDNHFTASSAYVIISYYSMFFTSMLQFWPLLVTHAKEAFSVVERIQELLLHSVEDETKFSNATDKIEMYENSEKLLMAEDVGRKMKRIVNENFEIKNISLRSCLIGNMRCDYAEMMEEKSYGIVGGNSTKLLEVILGEIEFDSGEIFVNGSLSFVGINPWIFSGSIRDNILFTEVFNSERYSQVLKICAIDKEIESLPTGDDTFIDSACINDSFKSRINLARCIYRNADIYLIDDCFSTITDDKMCKSIFKALLHFLKNKILLVATSRIDFLKQLDEIIAINMDCVHTMGSFREFRSSTIYEKLLASNEIEKKFSIEPEAHQSVVVEEEAGAQKSSFFFHQIPITEHSENQISENVEWSCYTKYVKSISGTSKCGLLWLMILFMLTQLNASGLEYFMAKWLNHEEQIMANRHVLSVNFSEISTANESLRGENEAANYYNWVNFVYFYSIILCTLLFFTAHRSLLFFKLCIRASVIIHDRLFCAITRATVRFFECLSSRPILDRFTADMETMDTQVPITLFECLMFILETLAITVLITFINYWLLFPTLIMLLAAYMLRYFYINTSRSLRRIESLTRNAIFARITSTFQGLATIHATRSERVLMDEFHRNVDLNTSATYLNYATRRAFAFWLDVIGTIYISAVMLGFLTFFKDDTKPADVGMVLTQILHLIFYLQWGLRHTIEIESQMTSLDKIFHYENVETEPPLRTPNKNRPTKEWPQNAKIIFTNFHLRYSPDAPDVLRDLNFKIYPGERIGIVGPKSSGKSSIIRALLRFAINEGQIEIDDINIDTLGLHDLRRAFAIIPADPILFNTSIRNNLDPCEQRTDDEIWNALERVNMKHMISSMREALNSKNVMFNVKQRQLLYLARAMLAKTKFLILDETTEKLDARDADEIHEIVRRNFSKCTILILMAERLNTVMECDNVIVLDEGRIAEMGHPYELIQCSRGYFRSLVDKNGYACAMTLIKVAEKSYMERRKKSSG